jgi:hypothetical protein
LKCLPANFQGTLPKAGGRCGRVEKKASRGSGRVSRMNAPHLGQKGVLRGRGEEPCSS